jgi:hypothetical protein
VEAAAMVEAVIVAPVLGILLIGSLFLYQWYINGQQARLVARRCAWEHAMTGCGNPPPAGCERYLGATAAASDPQADQLRALADDANRGGGESVLSHVPLLGNAIDGLFGTTTQADVGREVQAPWGKPKIQVRGEMVVLCNTQPVDVGDAIEKIFCDALPIVACDK